MKLGVFHAGFHHVGGAELLAVQQARALRALGADVRIRTFVYDLATWGPRIGSVPVDAYARCVPGRPPPPVPFRVSRAERAWALGGLGAFDAVIAHNFPTNALLGASPAPRHRIWYCHEPQRWLHPIEANPNLVRALDAAPAERGMALSYFAEKMVAPWRSHRRLRRGVFRLGQDDARGVAGLSEIWANSEFTRDNARRIYPGVPVEVVYPMAALGVPGRPRSGLDRGGLRVLTVSRLDRLKNVDTLLRGFALFLRRGGAGATLDLVGAGPVEAELAALAGALGIAPRVRFHGFVADAALEALYDACDVFALLPPDEPFGMVFPEAASRGLVVLGPDQGGPREILDDGRLGVVADPFDPEAIAAALERIWRTPDAEIDALRTRAAAACRARFSCEVIAAQLTRLLARRGLPLAAVRPA